MANVFEQMRDVKTAFDRLMEVGEFRGNVLADDEVVEERFKALRAEIERGVRMAENADKTDALTDIFLTAPAPMPAVGPGGISAVPAAPVPVPPWAGSSPLTTGSSMGIVSMPATADAAEAAEKQKAMMEEAEKRTKAAYTAAALLPRSGGGKSDAMSAKRAMELLKKLGMGKVGAGA